MPNNYQILSIVADYRNLILLNDFLSKHEMYSMY
jgi:hypothetical protein